MITKIVSGGQTGADRAALDFAIEAGISHGGWCPLGRQAEDGIILLKYQLIETPSKEYSQRTEWNVRDSDGSAIFTITPILQGGTALTAEFARKLEKPWLHLCEKRDGGAAAQRLTAFLIEYQIKILNVAGPRLLEESGIAHFVTWILQNAIIQRPTWRV